MFCPVLSKVFDAIENEEVRDCIYTLYNAGILTGSDAYGTFHPDDGITRAEVAAIMARIIDRLSVKPLH